MLAEYALDPELLSNWGDFRFYISQFGVSQGRLISEFPTKWKRMVKDVAKESAKDKEFLMITEALDRLCAEMHIRVHDYDQQRSWLKNAIEENKQRPFHAIATTTKKGTAKNLIDGKGLDPTKPHKLWVVPTSVQITRTPGDMANSVSVLLSQCDEVMFIDPYFGPGGSKYFLPLQEFLKAITNRGDRPQPTRIEYHTGNQDQDTAAFQTNLDTRVKSHLPTGVELKVVRWVKEEMHNRYILTDRGGVMFGHGLNCDQSYPTGNDTVSLLDDLTCANLMVEYSVAGGKLTWLNDSFSTIG